MKSATILLCLLLFPKGCNTSDNQYAEYMIKDGKFDHTLMFYNVENLFHPSDDSLPGDDDFTSFGVRGWGYKRYNRKITAVCKVIRASGHWDPPLFIGLCELENEQVLKDLVHHPLLINENYKYIHRDSPDLRGTDVALLYREEEVTPLISGFIGTCLPGSKKSTREIVYGIFELEGDTLVLFVNHWTSKYGGAYETERKRIYQAVKLRDAVDSVLHLHPHYKVIATGDFNDNSESACIKRLLQSGSLHEVDREVSQESYKYHGKWESIDHMFIGGNWEDGSYAAEIFSAPFLLEEDQTYTGLQPYRTYKGFKYNGGFSDHLPVLYHFSLRGEGGH